MPRLCQSTFRRLLILAVMSRPQHIHGDVISNLEVKSFGDLLLKRDQGRPGVIGAPPFSFDDLRAAGHVGCIRQTAVALQNPGSIDTGFELLSFHAVGCHDATAQHRHGSDVGVGRFFFQEAREVCGLCGRNVDEVEGRSVFRQ